MCVKIVFSFFLIISVVTSILVPYIDDVIFTAKSNSSSTILINRTCNECLCLANSSYVALNCFPNDTCEFFETFPCSYNITTASLARLYFLKQIFPNASQCCMPNTNLLLSEISTTNWTSASVLSPRCLVLDNHDYLVTISETNNSIVRFYSTNLTLITQPSPPNFSSTPLTITYYNDAYYVGFNLFIMVIDSNNFTLLNNITTSWLNGTRGMMFLYSGQIMVVVSTTNGFLLFFNRSSNVSRNYNFFYQQAVNYTNPHGLWYINDTYFYATSWADNTIYSYSAVKNSTTWTQKLFLNASSVAGSSNGNHLTIDECGRYWFSLGSWGVRIFNNQGSLLGNITQTNSSFFDTLITDDYVIYLSDTTKNQVTRIDLNIRC
jgi:hypothetical protein